MARVPGILHPSWISAARDRVESRDVVTCVRLLWLFYPFHVGARDNLWCAKRAYTHLRPAFTGWQMHARHTRQWQTQHSCAGHNAWNGVEDFLFFLLLLFFLFRFVHLYLWRFILCDVRCCCVRISPTLGIAMTLRNIYRNRHIWLPSPTANQCDTKICFMRNA